MVGKRGTRRRWRGWFLIRVGAAAWLMVAPTAVMACPDCAAGVRAAVRRGVFDNSFGPNLAATLAPFGIFLGVAAAVHSGRPNKPDARRRGEERP